MLRGKTALGKQHSGEKRDNSALFLRNFGIISDGLTHLRHHYGINATSL